MPAIRWEPKSLSEQPLVLCGPMLRKVTANEVNVFIALKENRQVKLQVFTTAGSVKGDSGWIDPVKLGDNLYIINLTTNITSPDLSPQTVYAYNVFFMGSSRVANLSSADVLKYGQSGTEPLVYSNSPTVGGIKLPSFVIPTNEINDLWMLHGSCRKPHGEGFDAMDGVNDIIESAVNSSTPNIRPQLICLTGDQIYADDVADSLLYMIEEVSLNLMPALWGYFPDLGQLDPQLKDQLDKDIRRKYGSEQLPSHYDKNNLDNVNFLSPGRRRTFIIDACNFYSYKADENGVGDACKSHLIKFCEFIAMYLFVWSDVLWEGTTAGLPTWDNVHKNIAGINGDVMKIQNFIVKFRREPVVGSIRDGFIPITEDIVHKKHFELENTRLLRFKATLPKVRKALANISSLMIMDDHEITDDLFYNHQWNTDVDNSAYGKKLITNGLAAYTIFQQWGNTPEQFSSGVGQTFLNHVENYESNIINIEKVLYPNMAIRPHLLISQETPYNEFKVTVVNYTPPQKITFNFIYSYPNNKYELIFLDTRRERASMYGDNRPPSIIDPAAVTVQIDNTSSFARKDLSIVANALPFLGSKHFEAVKSISGGIESRSTTVGYEKLLGLDMEGWEPFEDHVLFYYTLARLIGRSTSTSTPRQHRVVFLGGDVHFAFSKSIEMLYHKGFVDNSIPVGSQLKVASLCASSFKNETNKGTGTKYMHKITLAEATLGVDPIATEAFYFFGWNNLKKIKQTLEITDSSKNPPSIQKTIYQIPHIFKKSDFIIKHSTGGFPPTPPVIRDYSNGLQNPLPDFEGKLSIVNNNFNRDFDASALNNDTNLSNKSQILSEHKKYALDKDNKNGYVFVGKNNFGEITFNWNNGNAPEDKLVIHNLWWRDNDWENKNTPTIPPNNINIRTRHVISLNF